MPRINNWSVISVASLKPRARRPRNPHRITCELTARVSLGMTENVKNLGYRSLQFTRSIYRAFPYSSAHNNEGGFPMKTILKTLTCVLAFPLVLAACGGGGGDGGSTATGTLHVQMTHSSSCGFQHVYVTVSKVRVNTNAQAGDTDRRWTDVALSSPQKIDLLSLTNGVLADLGQTALPAGQYQQVRLLLAQTNQIGRAHV